MFKTAISLALIVIIALCLGAPSANAESKVEKQTRQTEKIKTGITQLGTGEQAGVQLKLKDQTKLKGYVSEANDDHFVVVDSKTGASTRVQYAQVQQAKGNNLSTGAKVAIGLGVLAAVLAILLIFENYG